MFLLYGRTFNLLKLFVSLINPSFRCELCAYIGLQMFSSNDEIWFLEAWNMWVSLHVNLTIEMSLNELLFLYNQFLYMLKKDKNKLVTFLLYK